METKEENKISRLPVVTFEDRSYTNVHKLEYDLRNQRLVHLGDITQQNVEQILSSTREFRVKSLILDIKERGLQEPLILYPQSNMVVEGNRRLCALKILSKIAELSDCSDDEVASFIEKNPYFEEFENLIDPNNKLLKQFENLDVPCTRISKGTSQDAIDAYLTSIHIAHKERWEKYNRAKMLHSLRKRGYSYTDIATIAEISRSTATKEINTFVMLNDYRKLHPEDTDWLDKFYHFYELLGTKGTTFRNKPQNISNFMTLVSSRVFKDSKDVREFLDVVVDANQSSFTQSDLKQMLSNESKYKPSFKSSIYTKIGQTIKILDNFSLKEFELVSSDPERRKFLYRLFKTCEKIQTKIERQENSR